MRKQNNRYQLAINAVLEPLVNRWPAWPYLVAPVPASLYLANYQINLLISYLEDPQSHIEGCRNPRLSGAPFADVPVEKAQFMADLLQRTRHEQGALLTLAEAFTKFQNELAANCSGAPMGPSYPRVPEPLRGLVELVYDYFHRASVRFLEGLVYASEYYLPHLQSFQLTLLEYDSQRSNSLNTPRVCGDGFNLDLQFDDPRVDQLCATEISPKPLGEIAELLSAGSGVQLDDISPFLEPADGARPYQGPLAGQIRVRHFGHACVLIEYGGISILTDPLIAVVPGGGGIERFSYRDLPARINYALITHSHQDHCHLETLLRLRFRIDCLVVPRSNGFFYGDPNLRLLMRQIGFKNVTELDAMESIEFPGGKITPIPFLGEHGDLPHAKLAYIIQIGTQSMLFAADSDCLDTRVYERVRLAVGPVRNLFIGTEYIGAPLSFVYGPLFPQSLPHAVSQSRRQCGADAADVIALSKELQVRRLFCYATGREPWLHNILGLGSGEGGEQWDEASKLFQLAREQSLTSVERLFAKAEFYLDPAEKYMPTLFSGASFSDFRAVGESSTAEPDTRLFEEDFRFESTDQ